MNFWPLGKPPSHYTPSQLLDVIRRMDVLLAHEEARRRSEAADGDE